jgi:hypothetical protein
VQRLLYQSLGVGFVVGLAGHAGGYLLKSSATTELFGLVADLLYALGWALWTGVVLVVFVQLVPEVNGGSSSRRWRPMRRRSASRPKPAATRGRGTTKRRRRGSGQADPHRGGATPLGRRGRRCSPTQARFATFQLPRPANTSCPGARSSSVDMGGLPLAPGPSVIVNPPAHQVSSAAFPARPSHPGEQPASQVDAHHRTGLVTGDQAGPPFIPPLADTAAGDDVLVGVAGQQAELERRAGGGSCLYAE